MKILSVLIELDCITDGVCTCRCSGAIFGRRWAHMYVLYVITCVFFTLIHTQYTDAIQYLSSPKHPQRALEIGDQKTRNQKPDQKPTG